MKLQSLLLLSAALSARANPISNKKRLPQFPVEDFADLEKRDGRRLIETDPGVVKWVTNDEKWSLLAKDVHFLDITDYPNEWPGVDTNIRAANVVFPTTMKLSSTIKPMIQKLQKDPMEQNLAKFSSFNNRYYKSTTGVQSSQWLLGKVNEIIKASGAVGATAKEFKHSWPQSSVIATIPGKSKKTIVLGAHQDSINHAVPRGAKGEDTRMNARAPGADDNGSGSVTILEAMRVLLQNDEIKQGNAPNTIEFHWYSAEEAGTLGSQAIFQAYKRDGRDVRAMLNQDMTGWTKTAPASLKTTGPNPQTAVGLITDFVDAGLTGFIEKVIKEYCLAPVVRTKCKYACSDHASASKAGYPSAFVIETAFEYTRKEIHTANDDLKGLDYDHMLEHAKMSLGLAVELAYADI